MSRVGLPRRLGAILYDSLSLCAIYFFFTLLLLPLRGGQAFSPGDSLYSAMLFAIGCLFFAAFWRRGGQTLGMKSWHIRLVTDNGHPIGWGQALLRCITALLSWACLGAGFWTCLFDRERRTWHDRISGTHLIRTD